MHRRLNRIMAAVVVTGALGGGGAALASAATSTSSSHSGAASSATQVARGKVAHAAARTHAMNGHCPGMTGSRSSGSSSGTGTAGTFQPGAPPQV
jgi:hypothetical protein